jgi:uncharacterized membrane protein
MFTMSDNAKNIMITSQTHRIVRILFLLTNLPYFLLAMARYTSPHPFTEHASTICSNQGITRGLLVVMSVLSTAFHTRQCTCSHGGHVRTSTQLNVMDSSCVAVCGAWIAVCFTSGKLLGIVPVSSLFFLGDRAKRRNQYTMYMVYHGLWHLVSAHYMRAVLCE